MNKTVLMLQSSVIPTVLKKLLSNRAPHAEIMEQIYLASLIFKSPRLIMLIMLIKRLIKFQDGDSGWHPLEEFVMSDPPKKRRKVESCVEQLDKMEEDWIAPSVGSTDPTKLPVQKEAMEKGTKKSGADEVTSIRPNAFLCPPTAALNFELVDTELERFEIQACDVLKKGKAKYRSKPD